jgi:hypothetical protein
MGVSPPPLGLPPNAITPREGNNSTITLRRGGLGGQALSPPSKHLSFLFCTYLILYPSGNLSKILLSILRYVSALRRKKEDACGGDYWYQTIPELPEYNVPIQ